MNSNLLSPEASAWLGRATYGVNTALAQSFLKLGNHDNIRWEKFVNEQLIDLHPKDEVLEKKIEKLKLETLKKTLSILWEDHRVAVKDMRETIKEKSRQENTSAHELKTIKRERRELALEPIHDLVAMTWMHMVHSKWQIYERTVEFWHDHFNIFGYEKRTSPGILALNRDVIRPLALGNFRRLLGQVCKNPAMLYYLDNAYNQSGNPNENFARELFELHTLGADNYLGTIDRDAVPRSNSGQVMGYVDGDVYEAARCFTGWRVADGTAGLEQNNGEFYYHDVWHDRFQKIVLGQKIPEHQPALKDGEDVLDILCSHPGTARHLMQKFCRYFVADNPPEELINQLAESFLSRKDSPTQIRDTLKELFSSKYFLSMSNRKFKRPVDYFTSLIRVVCDDFTPSEKFMNSAQKSGHKLFGWRTPDGAPEKAEPWQSPQSLIDRWRTAQQIIKNEIPGSECSIESKIQDTPISPESMVPLITQQMFSRTLDSSFLKTLIEVAAAGRRTEAHLPSTLATERIQWLAELCALSPEFQVRS